MPCSDSSSGLNFKFDHDDCLIDFEYAKITCSSEIEGETGYKNFCVGQELNEILNHDFPMLVSVLGLNSREDQQFILHLEWEALRAAIGLYLGVNRDDIDTDRCLITSIENGPESTEVALVILPPKEMPKIISCSKKE